MHWIENELCSLAGVSLTLISRIPSQAKAAPNLLQAMHARSFQCSCISFAVEVPMCVWEP